MSSKSAKIGKGKLSKQVQDVSTVIPILDDLITQLEKRVTELEVKLLESLSKTNKPVDAIAK